MHTRLSPHCIWNSADGMRLARAGSPVIKLMNDYSMAVELNMLLPRPLIIGRVYENDFQIDVATDPIATARHYIDRHLATTIRANPLVDAWEGPNEPVFEETEKMGWYARFLAEFARVIWEGFGKRAILGNWSVGRPDPYLWKEYIPALDAVRKYRGFLGRHEYGGPDRNGDTWLLLRSWRDQAIFTDLGYPGMPTIINECGADRTPGNPPGQPWRLLDWTPEQYAQYLIEYDKKLAEMCPFVLGATIFTYGNSTGWPDFDLEGTPVTDILEAHIRANQEGAMPTPTIEIPPGTSVTLYSPPSAGGLQPLYRAVTLQGLTLRYGNGGAILDASSKPILIPAGKEVSVWAHIAAGLYTRRAVIVPTDTPILLNIWIGSSDATPTLRRL